MRIPRPRCETFRSPRTRSSRRRSKGAEGEEKLDLTSMVDIVFLLLVFFMVATQFRAEEGSLDSWLPRDRGSDGISTAAEEVCRISLTREGNSILAWADQRSVPPRAASDLGEDDDAIRALADQEAALGLVGPDRRVIEEHLRGRLDTCMGVSPRGLPVVIDCAGDVPSSYAVTIVDLCKKLRIEEVRFAIPAPAE